MKLPVETQSDHETSQKQYHPFYGSIKSRVKSKYLSYEVLDQIVCYIKCVIHSPVQFVSVVVFELSISRCLYY